MTIEEKAKRFDETLEQLKGLIEVTREDKCDIAEEDIIDIFPELKESEDERIRKAIHIYLDWLDGRKDYAPRGEYTIRDMIDWLEKQGEYTDINPSEFDLRLNKLLKQFETLPKEELASSLSFYLNVVQNDGTYKAEEKQGEQKSSDEVEPIEWSGKINSRNAKGVLKEMLDKKLKSADKVEPKFKVGDKVIGIISGMQYYITKVCDNHYCTESGCIIMFDAQDNFELVEQQLKKIEQKPADKIEDEEYNGEDYGIDSLFHAQRILEKTLGKVEGYQTDDGILSHKCAISAVKKLYALVM